MSMNGDALGTAIADAIEGLTDAQKRSVETVWQTIAAEIVIHIQSNAEVSTSVDVVSVSGVTPGTGTSGPGTGSGSGGVS